MTLNTWAEAMQECEDPSKRDANLWAQCFAEADGDVSKAKAAYIKTKVGAPSGTHERAPHPRRGYCPSCGDECDMESTFCTTCRTNLTGQLRPTREKSLQRPSSHAPSPAPQTVQMVKTAKSRGTYVILGLLLGMLGIHNFYAGRFLRGALQFASTALLGWFVIGLVITSIWVLVDLFTVTTDGAGDAFA